MADKYCRNCGNELAEDARLVNPGVSTKGRVVYLVAPDAKGFTLDDVSALMRAGASQPPGRGRPRISPEAVAGDKGYCSGSVRHYLQAGGIAAVIPTKAVHSPQPAFDRVAYRERILVERLINRLKKFRRLATRYEKRAAKIPGGGDGRCHLTLAVELQPHLRQAHRDRAEQATLAGGGRRRLMEGTEGPPPEAAIGQMAQMATGYWISGALRTMVVLGLADHLAAGQRTAHELAEQSGAHAPSLDRLLRALCALGLCTRDEEGRVGLTKLGELLRSDVPDSMKSSVLLLTAPYSQRTWEKLPDAVRTGEPTFSQVHGVGFWDYLAAHPEEGALFDAAMSEDAEERAEALLAACDLSGVTTIVDVGGGQGKLLAAVLAAVPNLRGILADRPEVVAGAEEVLRTAGVAERCAVVGGDFFASAPPGGDAYVLAQIIHDWPEEEALEILRTCHRAMAPGARLWVIEQVIEPGEDSVYMLFDLNMLLFFGGQERTAEEYKKLLEAAGFGEVRVLPTDTDWSVVEAVRP